MSMNNYLTRFYGLICDKLKIHLIKRVSNLSNSSALIYPDLVSLEYLAIGKYEPDIISAIKSLDFNDTFVDIGANLGLVSIQLKNTFNKFILVEANPRIIDFLEYNLTSNGLNSYTVIPNPISNVGGSKCYVSLESGNVGGGRLIHDLNEANLNPLLETTSISIEDFLNDIFSTFTNEERHSILFKIDIEGLELNVISKIIQIFKDVNYAVIFENWQSLNTSVDRDLLRIIFNSGRVYQINTPRKIPPSLPFLAKVLWCITSPLKTSMFDQVFEVKDGDYIFVPNGSGLILK
jgi:FkbM family methyltransferase